MFRGGYICLVTQPFEPMTGVIAGYLRSRRTGWSDRKGSGNTGWFRTGSGAASSISTSR